MPRRGIREYFGVWRYRWRPRGSFVRTIDSGVRGLLVTDLDGQTDTRELEFELLEIRSADGDELSFEVEFNREVLDEPFEIRSGIAIPPGDYRFNRLGSSLRTSDGRPLSVFASVEGGEFFDGDRLDFELGAELRPSPHLFLGFSWAHNDVKLPAGDCTLQIAQARVNGRLSPNGARAACTPFSTARLIFARTLSEVRRLSAPAMPALMSRSSSSFMSSSVATIVTPASCNSQ